jgi:hypothetical protein
LRKRKVRGDYVTVCEQADKTYNEAVKGPAKAIFASCPGFFGISSIEATPPKRKRVMLIILAP